VCRINCTFKCCGTTCHEYTCESAGGNSAVDISRHGEPDHRTNSGADLSTGANPEHNG
jgi:hypothetical protein